MKLYDYFRSSTAYRVRIGLHLKGLAFESVPVNIFKGEHKSDAYRRINPTGGVPVLEHGGFVLAQSLAILDYIDALQPEPPLLGGSIADRAFAREVALTIATEVHPLVNMKVLHRLESDFGADEEAKTGWKTHWAMEGMAAVESLLRRRGGDGPYAMGAAPGLVDLCLVPQMYFMRRNNLDLTPFPICRRIEAACVRLPAFIAASPEMQQDAPKDLEPIHGPAFKGEAA
jgi:maleylacetoacetate isomerase